MRRGNGEGSIFKLGGKRRKPYAVRITVGYTDEGKQHYKLIIHRMLAATPSQPLLTESK